MIIQSKIDFEKNQFLMFKLDQIAYDKEAAGQSIIRMTLGKSELPVNDKVSRAIAEAALDFEKYTRVHPGGLPELRQALASFYNAKYGVTLNEKNIIIGCGTSSLFRNLFQLLCKPGDEVLLPLPYYSLYNFCAQLAGATVRYYKIDLSTLQLDHKSFEENFTEKTRIVVINSPGNPLGNIVTDADLRKMDAVIRGRAVIVNDEIYANTYFDEPPRSVLQTTGLETTLITTNAFSKAYRMYARRVGYCIIPEELELPMRVIQDHTLLTLDPIVQFGAIEALKDDSDVLSLVNLYRGRRDYTVQSFVDSSTGVRVLPAKGSFYITLDCSEFMKRRGIPDSLDLAERIIHSTNVATVPGSDFGIPNTLRLSYSCHAYKEGIDRLRAFFATN